MISSLRLTFWVFENCTEDLTPTSFSTVPKQKEMENVLEGMLPDAFPPLSAALTSTQRALTPSGTGKGHGTNSRHSAETQALPWQSQQVVLPLAGESLLLLPSASQAAPKAASTKDSLLPGLSHTTDLNTQLRT